MLLYAQIYMMNMVDRMLAATIDLSGLTDSMKSIVQNLIGPVQTIGGIILAAMFLFFALKALAGDEQDVKQSIKRAKICFVVFVILMAFTTVVNALLKAAGSGVSF